MDIINRLASLFSENHSGTLEFLSKIGVIAGGSMVYAINDFVPRDSVSDVDIFVPNVENFKNAVVFLNDKYKCKFYRYHGSVVSVDICEKIKLQLIYKSYETPMDVIESFDMDYVQCCFHDGNLYKTDRCIESHKDRKVYQFSGRELRSGRCKKAILKGFKCPILNKNDTNPQCEEVDFSDVINGDITEFHRYMDVNQGKTWYLMDTVKIVDFEDVRRLFPDKNLSKCGYLLMTGGVIKITFKDTDGNIHCEGIKEVSYDIFVNHEGRPVDKYISGVYNQTKIDFIPNGRNRIVMTPYFKYKLNGFHKCFVTDIVNDDSNVLSVPISSSLKSSERHYISFDIRRYISGLYEKSERFSDQTIKEICKYYSNSKNVAVSNCASAYLYYRYCESLSEEEAVRVAVKTFIFDSNKANGIYDTLGLMVDLQCETDTSYGGGNYKTKSFEMLFERFLRK